MLESRVKVVYRIKDGSNKEVDYTNDKRNSLYNHHQEIMKQLDIVSKEEYKKDNTILTVSELNQMSFEKVKKAFK